MTSRKRVVVVGGGFGGLWAVRALRSASVDITLIDRCNHHLFQPLLYQVATAGLAAPSIAAPLRHILRRQRNVAVMMGEVRTIDLAARRVYLGEQVFEYDCLVIATGAAHAYFGHDEWARHAVGLKTLQDALAIRARVLTAFERAELATDAQLRETWLTFAIIGAGPTGVELAGTLAEIARHTLAPEFRRSNPQQARVLLIEAGERVLSSFPPALSAKAAAQLLRLGVTVRTGQAVTGIGGDYIELGGERIATNTVLWAAGVSASPLGAMLGAPLDRAGRVKVQPDLSLAAHPEVLVVGDLASVATDGRPVPGIAPAAKQMGAHAARCIRATLAGRSRPPFRYRDYGSLATIGRRAAVVDIHGYRLSGTFAWCFWLAAHIYFLIGFRNRLVVLIDWAWAYFSYERSARIFCAGWLLMTVALMAAAPVSAGTSAFRTAPADPRAVTVTGKGDGRADDTDAIQHALDAATEHSAGGVAFLPSGRYRISHTLLISPGVRLYGVGATRPVLVLGSHTPGFQQGVGSMVVFTGARRGDPVRTGPGPSEARVPFPPPTVVPFDPKVADANSSTFYSVMSNIDIEIGPGNPAATGIRFRVAQHAYLSNMDFHLGGAFAGIYQAGNFVQNLHFEGGRYGIVTEKTSPAWQFTVLDSSFEGQSGAAIREHEADLTLIDVTVRNVPVGIEIDRGYGDSLWGKDVRFEGVRQAGVVISNEGTVYTQVGFDNALARDTPVFVHFRDSGRNVAGEGRSYRVRSFSYGLAVPGLGQLGHFATSQEIMPIERLPAPGASAVRSLPPVAEWANVHELGAVGDGKADDTLALQRAIDAHRAVYLPLGVYRVSDTLRLRPDSALIGLHPSLTRIEIADGTAAFQGVGAPKPLLQSAAGGDAIVSGIGLLTGGVNPRATALLWSAGEKSLVIDVKFELPRGTPGGAESAQRWDGQYPSLWVSHGGGTFVGNWSPDTYASAGLYISDTDTPGHVYEMSVEHHVRNEIVLNHVSHWEFLAPQTEEEYRESRNAVSVELRDSHDILFANYHGYRVTRTVGPAPAAVRLYGVHDLHFRNVHVNAESGFSTCDGGDCTTFLRLSKYPFDNAIEEEPSGAAVREREFARLDVSSASAAALPAASMQGAVLRKLAGGFEALGGGAVDARGTLYFIDRITQRIYSWSGSGLAIISSQPLDPVNLAVDHAGNLLVLSSAGITGAVYSLRPDGPDGAVTVIQPGPAQRYPQAQIAIPAVWWVNGEFKDQYDPQTDHFATLAELFAREVATGPALQYSSPDGSLVLPAYRVFHQGALDYRGWRFSHSLDTYGFLVASPGSRLYVSNASEAKTYSARLGSRGALEDLKVFAERGGESVTSDAAGRVYLANGQIFVYGADGSELGIIEVPERPLQLLAAGHSLFILTHHSLYSVDLPVR
ncbi:MAG TPA: FAD-dependent oxidoreductase [Steroidobacteraceae bacterium]|nr:FAD-dependent oxidoreductase [Steroidobacteraceae bacterium]